MELEDVKALAEDRLKETEVLSQQIVQLKVELELAQEKTVERSVAEGDITATATYLSLQAQFSILQQGSASSAGEGLYNIRCRPVENNQLRASVEELKTLLYEARAQHFAQLDELRYRLCVVGEGDVCICDLYRAEEVKYEGEVREEMAQLEALLAGAKRDYELLRIEFEKRMAANEQAAPLAK